jgi:hypothetical protein
MTVPVMNVWIMQWYEKVVLLENVCV